MPVYECRFRVDAIRKKLIECSDEDVAAEQTEDTLREEMGLEKHEVYLLDMCEVTKDDMGDA